MLCTVGVVLDGVISRRISKTAERSGGFHKRQYGFREGKDTVEAAGEVLRTLQRNRVARKHSLMVTLDL